MPQDASSDQSNCPSGYYRNASGMVMQKPDSSPIASANEISPADLARLDTLTREELLELIRKAAGAIWGYALMDDAQKAEAARLKLYNLGMSATEVHKVVPALDHWFDRTQGKAPQSVAMTVEDKGLSRIDTDRLIRLAGMLDDPVIIAPLPSNL